MTISSYQVENVIREYSKQSKTRVRAVDRQEVANGRYADLVTFSGNDSQKADANNKISYSLLDVLLKNKKVEP